LAVISDHFDVARLQARFTHQRPRRFGIDGAGEVVEAVELEKGDLVLERAQHDLGDRSGPVVSAPGDEPRPRRVAVGAVVDLDQHDVDAVKR
jgi:hypothetical protein